MLIRRAEKLALIHLARKDRGLDEVAYRSLLNGAAGVDSASKIETEAQFEEVMKSFVNLGFKRRDSGHGKMDQHGGGNPGFCTVSQLSYIRGLWRLASRVKDERSLNALVQRISKVDDITFLTKGDASKVILALRDICWRAGINPDRPEPANAERNA